MWDGISPKTKLKDHGDYIAVFGNETMDAIRYGYLSDSADEFETEFRDKYEIVKANYFGHWLSSTDMYQVIDCCTVIKRKLDGKLFGVEYYTSIGKYPESDYIQPEAYEYGYDLDYSIMTYDEAEEIDNVYILLPVELFNIQGYRIERNKNASSND